MPGPLLILARTLLPAALLAAGVAASYRPVQAAGTLVCVAEGYQDGDSLTCAGLDIRLQGVAAPEVAHPGIGVAEEPGGPEAAAFVRQLTAGKLLTCQITERDHYGRPAGVCRLPDGRDVGEAVIRAGLARDCGAFSGGRYAAEERPEAASLPMPPYCSTKGDGR